MEYLLHQFTSSELAVRFCVSERTVRRYIDLFHQTRDVEPRIGQVGRRRLLGEYEQAVLLHTILSRPGIYLRDSRGVVRSFWCPCQCSNYMQNSKIYWVYATNNASCSDPEIRYIEG